MWYQFLLQNPVSKIFTDNTDVITYSAYYLWIMIIGLSGLTLTNWMSQLFTTIGRPIWTVILNVGGTMLIIIPMAYAGRAVFGYIGVLCVRCRFAQIIVGIVSVWLTKHKNAS